MVKISPPPTGGYEMTYYKLNAFALIEKQIRLNEAILLQEMLYN